VTSNYSPAVDLIAAERARQIEEIGYTPEHDTAHPGDCARAAIVYTRDHDRRTWDEVADKPYDWPWSPESYRPSSDRVRELTKAGALVAAEIDRIQFDRQKGLASSEDAFEVTTSTPKHAAQPRSYDPESDTDLEDYDPALDVTPATVVRYRTTDLRFKALMQVYNEARLGLSDSAPLLSNNWFTETTSPEQAVANLLAFLDKFDTKRL
jgi:hypothetical protein